RRRPHTRSKRDWSSDVCSSDLDYDESLFEKLRDIRKTIADETSVPPYLIFSDVTLKDMCRYLPKTEDDLLAIKGVGERKLNSYRSEERRVGKECKVMGAERCLD